jgi:hypothetical protein
MEMSGMGAGSLRASRIFRVGGQKDSLFRRPRDGFIFVTGRIECDRIITKPFLLHRFAN